MSGGHFNGNDYVYFRVRDFAEELEEEIANNNKIDEYGSCKNFKPETLEYLKKQVKAIEVMSRIMREIDYLYSGDTGEDTFFREIHKIERE